MRSPATAYAVWMPEEALKPKNSRASWPKARRSTAMSLVEAARIALENSKDRK
jgi:hypothetical protein